MACASLWFHRDFRLLWAGDTVSQFGTLVGHTVLPLLAVTVLAATPLEMGLLTAAETVAFLALGLPAGVWVDRARKRSLMQWANLARGALLSSVPVAWWLDLLTLPQLVVVALLTGVCTLFFDVSYQSYLPALVDRGQLLEGNAKLQTSQSLALVTGPGIGGALTQLVGAANAVTATAASYLASAALLRGIRTVEAPPRRPVTSLRADIAEGLRFVFGNPTLRAIVACTATANLANGAFTAVEVLFLTRHVGLDAAGVGIVLSIGGAGGVFGALTASWWIRRIGQARAIWLVPALAWPFELLVPLAAPGWRVVLAPIGLAVFGWAVILYNVAQVSYRQAICPDRLLGRMNASVRFVVWGVMPLGGLAGGVLGELIGVPAAVWTCVAGLLLGALWVLLSPLRSMRDIPVERSSPV
jgi:predicted MFS family arabinose efflux permease